MITAQQMETAVDVLADMFVNKKCKEEHRETVIALMGQLTGLANELKRDNLAQSLVNKGSVLYQELQRQDEIRKEHQNG